MKFLSRVLPLAVLLPALLTQNLNGALSAFMRATGDTQGEIKGGVVLAGREDSMEVLSYEHQVISPRDAATGLPTGKRQHGAVKITKEIDKATPLLYTALVSNENLSEVEIRFWRPDPSGKEVQYYTVQLTNASISSIRQWKANNKDPEGARLPDMEEIQITYEQISWTIEEGGITAQDNPGAAAAP